MDKKNQSESDVSDKFTRPAMVQAGCHTLEQIYAQYPLWAGRVVVRGRTAKRDHTTVLHADYALFLKPNISLAVVEAKKSSLSMQAGMQQATRVAHLRRLCVDLRQRLTTARTQQALLAEVLVKEVA